MKKIAPFLVVVLSMGLFFTSCEKDKNDPDPGPVTDSIPVPDEINSFIWYNMHDFYLWNEQVPELTNVYYNNQKNTDSLYTFLNKYTDHEKLFYDLLYDYGNTDKFSWIVDDYEVLEKEFEGITKSMGYNFMLARYGAGDGVFGYVRYVVKGAPADKAGIKRGDLFTQVNGQNLTINNYMDLLVNSQSYKLGLAAVENRTLVLKSETPVMTAVEVYENPIYLDTVYTINNQKIGYLVYNSFASTYDTELNEVMLRFKGEGITKLILDLRYNGGGSVQSAVYLASMIYDTNSSNVFLKSEYNNILQEYLKQEFGEDYFNIAFASNISKDENVQIPINTLNLQDLYVITSDNTASASESVIVGLKPYITVRTIGTTTYGKYVGSMTLKDYDEEGNLNPNHKWALQPIVLKLANSAGYTDYVNGLQPNVTIEEDVENMSVLGDLNEPLLSRTITDITGVTAKKAKMPSQFKYEMLPQKEDLIHKKEMHYNIPGFKFKGFKK